MHLSNLSDFSIVKVLRYTVVNLTIEFVFNTGHKSIGTKLLPLAINPFIQPKHALEAKLLNLKIL